MPLSHLLSEDRCWKVNLSNESLEIQFPQICIEAAWQLETKHRLYCRINTSHMKISTHVKQYCIHLRYIYKQTPCVFSWKHMYMIC